VIVNISWNNLGGRCPSSSHKFREIYVFLPAGTIVSYRFICNIFKLAVGPLSGFLFLACHLCLFSRGRAGHLPTSDLVVRLEFVNDVHQGLEFPIINIGAALYRSNA